jgi:hypothetical protein
MDEPIYVKYTNDYETFYNAVAIFNIEKGIEIEIVEEVESLSALNVMLTYSLCPHSTLKLTTFYKNRVSATSILCRSIIAQESSIFSHVLLGKGSAEVIDENRIRTSSDSKSEFMGIINADNRTFHSVLIVEPTSLDYSIDVDYRNIATKKSNITFTPIIEGHQPIDGSSSIEVTHIMLEDIPPAKVADTLGAYLKPIFDRAILGRMVGIKRFYENKSRFLQL